MSTNESTCIGPSSIGKAFVFIHTEPTLVYANSLMCMTPTWRAQKPFEEAITNYQIGVPGAVSYVGGFADWQFSGRTILLFPGQVFLHVDFGVMTFSGKDAPAEPAPISIFLTFPIHNEISGVPVYVITNIPWASGTLRPIAG